MNIKIAEHDHSRIGRQGNGDISFLMEAASDSMIKKECGRIKTIISYYY